jgi:hypothetical protein
MRFLISKFIFSIFLSFTIVFFNNIQFLNLISVFSQGDDKKGFGIQERERTRIHEQNDSQIVNDDRFGIQERERTRIHEQNDSQFFSNDITGIILIVTIIVIIGVSSYALYKIYLIKRKSKQSKLK